ncbi:CoA-acylating methylmalonate-semialdehyde dehydrogenase [Shewanella nanhaiensis]|uniref:methylmalonate-semialdehyde dehydrogenase (CoA acylating) n=1 Tax=Shewanella nanhaiensis TaxID=2864872 RepID=A0ABS7E5R8_9GAMM|nr:CoA-acylating methylmalonate-semialdehyde dehydrogenase [Shewanella nanhaiensis]MBW8185027.1 CoA-acylating methylmalonate-semialdehyde dehydrogenase [Shewanella nanhaiensis]
MKQLTHFINNQITEAHSLRVGAVFNPATGEQVAEVDLADSAVTEDALVSASNAFTSWSKTSPLLRARVMFKFKVLIEEHRDTLAKLITEQHGKVLSDAQGEITRGLEVVEFASGIPHLLKGEHSLNAGSGVDSHSMMQAVGVCVGITPFNFPVMVPMWMFPVSIACGNTFILKPSEKNPEPALFLAELLRRAGLPDGVFNVVNGDKTLVESLISDSRVEAVSFVGSTPIAEAIYSKASAYGKRCQALGGAKNHMVIMPDAEVEQAVNALMGAAYGSAGERCMAISVAVCIGDETADRVKTKLLKAIETLKIGNGADQMPEPDMGPLVSAEHKDRVMGYIETGVAEGAELVVDGRDLSVVDHEVGYFVGPTLFDHVTKEMKIYQEEIFGPVLAIVRVKDLDAALALVNSHEFGNGTAIFTQNGRASRRYQEEVKVGMVGINVPIPVPMSFHCFGGWKRSIFGPLNMHGPDGVRFYTKMKTVTSRWPKTTDSIAEFSMPTLE